MRTRICGALAVLGLLSCQDPHGPALMVQMDSTVYGRDSTGMAHAGFTVTNFGDAPAYQQGCERPATILVDRGTARGWAASFGAEGCMLGDVSLSQVLQPGQSYQDSCRWDLPGTYRVRVPYGSQPGDAYALEAVGPGFTLR